MKKICMFCGKEHKTKRPRNCEIKSVAASALFDSINQTEALLILDRTKYLDVITKKMNRLLKPKK